VNIDGLVIVFGRCGGSKFSRNLLVTGLLGSRRSFDPTNLFATDCNSASLCLKLAVSDATMESLVGRREFWASTITISGVKDAKGAVLYELVSDFSASAKDFAGVSSMFAVSLLQYFHDYNSLFREVTGIMYLFRRGSRSSDEGSGESVGVGAVLFG
jgi:hypothetical protein